jgi:hypothetical protein
LSRLLGLKVSIEGLRVDGLTPGTSAEYLVTRVWGSVTRVQVQALTSGVSAAHFDQVTSVRFQQLGIRVQALTSGVSVGHFDQVTSV